MESVQEMVLVVDFGGQYNQLIARRVRDCHVYCEVVPYNKALEAVKEKQPKGIIFTGGPNSVYAVVAPQIDPAIFEQGIPVLGLCYGMQIMAHTLGGKVEAAEKREFGKTVTQFDTNAPVFKNLPQESVTWMSHVDYVAEMPNGFTNIAHTGDCPIAAMMNTEKNLYAMQYHPEVNHSEKGVDMLKNFLSEVCGCSESWPMANYAKTAIESIRQQVGDGQVLLALSGGVESSVAAPLLSKANGSPLT